jgi:hypothetical protein
MRVLTIQIAQRSSGDHYQLTIDNAYGTRHLICDGPLRVVVAAMLSWFQNYAEPTE